MFQVMVLSPVFPVSLHSFRSSFPTVPSACFRTQHYSRERIPAGVIIVLLRDLGLARWDISSKSTRQAQELSSESVQEGLCQGPLDQEPGPGLFHLLSQKLCPFQATHTYRSQESNTMQRSMTLPPPPPENQESEEGSWLQSNWRREGVSVTILLLRKTP